jgi:hypothetical protein
MYAGEVPRYIGRVNAFYVPWLRGRRQVVTALSVLCNPPHSAMVLEYVNCHMRLLADQYSVAS